MKELILGLVHYYQWLKLLTQNDLNDVSYEEFVKNDVLVRATSFSILQIGELMGKLEQKIGKDYPDLPWRESKSMRNVLVHDYENADPEIIYKTAQKNLKILYKEFSKIYQRPDLFEY